MDFEEKLQSVCRDFGVEGTYLGYETIQEGNVNKTYHIRYRKADGQESAYLLQNVNTFVFRHPVQVMENIGKVTEHIRAKRPGKVALKFYRTAEGKTYQEDGENFWRMTNYIPSSTFGACQDLRVVRSAGDAFGEFQMQLSDFSAEDLFETIPGFHNTKKRYEKLEETVAKDPMGLVSQVKPELDYLFSVRDLACRLTELWEQGELPQRVTHNDTKINNVLFEKDGTDALVVIDLDTVMPGLVGHDFGDAIRFAANFVEEDARDAEKAGVDLDVFRAFAEGFLKQTAKVLTKNEIDTLALSCFVLTAELAVRFLDDYILGSPYFKTLYPEHNLVRTRCQIALAKDMQKKLPEMEQCVRDCVKAYLN